MHITSDALFPLPRFNTERCCSILSEMLVVWMSESESESDGRGKKYKGKRVDYRTPPEKSAAPVVLNRRPARNSEHLQLLWLETSHHFPSASTARSTDQNVPRDDFQNTR